VGRLGLWGFRALVLAGAAAVVTAAAAAAPPVGSKDILAGSLTITPAILEASAKPSTKLAPIGVTNGTKVPFHIQIYPALVSQDLDGSLLLRKPSRGRTRARLPFVLHPQRIVLRPGKSVSVSVLFLRRTPGVLGAQAAAVIEATPPPARRPSPTYRLRLLAALLVRLPNAPGARGRFAAPLAIEDQAGHLRLCARIRNTGRVFGYSRDLLLRVRSARGRLVFAAPLRSSFVLAGFQRDFCVNGPRRLPAGRYRVEAQGFFGDVRMRAVSTRFLWDPHRPRRGP
jgi:hypothetical protein